ACYVLATDNNTVRMGDAGIFFVSSRSRHTRSKRDWSSDVCSSDLQEARRHPTPSLRPPRHGWGRKQPLAKHAGCDVEIRNTRNLREAQFLESRERELNRALDLRPHRGRAVEIARKKDRFKQRRNLVAIIPQNCTELFLNFGSHLLANEKSIDLSCDKTRRDRLFQDDVDHIHPIEVARVSEKRLGIPVVLLFMNDELQIDVIPASESARRLAHILFRIVADAHLEQFH